jgi:hypothetical protein
MRRLVAIALVAAVGCDKKPSSSSNGSPANGTDLEAADVVLPMDSREASQWAAAAAGEPEELMRLEDLVGCAGLRERATQRDLRGTALRAMQYCADFSELGWLAQIADQGNDDDARAALETIDALAARPRRATDPDDADELHAGCGVLLGLARTTARPPERRLLAVRALRMLADRGCPQIPAPPQDH